MSKSAKFDRVPTSEEDTTSRLESEESDSDYQCGVYHYRPQWLQRFAKAYWFVVCHILFGMFQGALKTYLNGSITTIERKFALTGKMLGVVMIADNVSGLFASLFIGYYATKISRPKIIVFGIWMSVLSCLLSALPYFAYGPGFIGKAKEKLGSLQDEVPLLNPTSQKEFCAMNGEQSYVHDDSPAPTAIMAVTILFLANFLNGLGGTAFYISGTTYMDDNIDQKSSPIFFGMVFSLRLVGPMLGYVVASVCLGIYESPFDDPGISKKHPTWIGAWWLGFIIWAVAMALMSLPMSLFPKKLRRQPLPTEKTSFDNQVAGTREPKSFTEVLKDDIRGFKVVFRRLSRNPVLLWQIATLVFVYNGLGGYISMFPKYIENSYRVSASRASLFTGPTKLLAMMVGLFLGGLLIRLWRPSARSIMLLAAATNFIDLTFVFSGMFLGCSGWKLAGTSISDTGRLSIENSCNAMCSCSTRAFQPVCDVLNRSTYFSPCAAGCFDRGNGSMLCTCLSGAGNSSSGISAVEDGFCEFPCGNLYLLVLLVSIGKLICQLPGVGTWLVSLRCVSPADKGMAIGLIGSSFNLLAAIPFPLIYNSIFDATCLVWDQRGGHRGNCWFYDVDTLRVAYHGVTVTFLGLGLVCQLMVAYHAKRVTDMYGDVVVQAVDAPASRLQGDQMELENMVTVAPHPRKYSFN